MTDFIPSIAVDDVIESLGAFIQPFMNGGQVVRAQVNRTPMPNEPCAVLTELLSVDLSIPYQDNLTLNSSTRIDVQIDFYGPLASEQSRAVQTAFRTGYGFDTFPFNVKPLYTSDGVQAPLVTGEQQWESRWTLTVSMQYNPVVTVPQQSATTATVNIVSAVDL